MFFADSSTHVMTPAEIATWNAIPAKSPIPYPVMPQCPEYHCLASTAYRHRGCRCNVCLDAKRTGDMHYWQSPRSRVSWPKRRMQDMMTRSARYCRQRVAMLEARCEDMDGGGICV